MNNRATLLTGSLETLRPKVTIDNLKPEKVHANSVTVDDLKQQIFNLNGKIFYLETKQNKRIGMLKPNVFFQKTLNELTGLRRYISQLKDERAQVLDKLKEQGGHA